MKFKKLSEKQIIISIDRLTRFKSVEDKYLRVFKDIIINNLIEPKYKKSELEKLDYSTIRDIAVEIFNSSLNKNDFSDFTINNRLKEYENSIFNISDSANILLENKLDYKSAITLLKEDLPKNLEWLIELSKTNDFIELRRKKQLQYPLSMILIVEGITEEILLPEFANILGFNFLENGIKIIPAGGKNQVVKLYYSLSQEIKIPIFVLLDKDAVENKDLISNRLRKCDNVHILDCGEFEDILPEKLIIKTVNSHLKNLANVINTDIKNGMPMVKVLEELYKEKGVYEFKKSEFATLLKSNIKTSADVSDEIADIVSEIKSIATTKSLI